jgi:hypothetical protein
MIRYRVKTPFAGVYAKEPGCIESIILEAGAIITIRRDRTVLPSGLVDISHGDLVLSVYLRDIRERTEVAEETQA